MALSWSIYSDCDGRMTTDHVVLFARHTVMPRLHWLGMRL